MNQAFLSDKTKVAYWEYNTDQTPTIVMIHGFRGTHHGLLKIAKQLPDFRIVVPDLPGFGDSMPFQSKAHSLESYITFVDEFLKTLHLDKPPILLGHSFGSIIASHFAAQHPKAIEKLILINPIGAPALKGPRAVLTRLAIMYYWLGKKLPAPLDRKWLANPAIVKIMSVTMAKTSSKELLRYIHDQHLRYFSTFANPKVVNEAFRTSVSYDVAEVANKLRIPTLLIAGEKDDITPLEKQHQLAQQNPLLQLEVIPQVGHLIHYETPKEGASLIARFLRQ